VAWADGRGGDGLGDIYMRSYDGTQWGPEERAVDGIGDCQYPSVAVDGAGTIHLAWHELRNGNSEVYYKSLSEAVWTEDEGLTAAADASTLPCIAFAQEGSGYLLWTDARDGNTEVYFKRRTKSGAGAPETGAPVAIGEPRMIRLVWPARAKVGRP
jgi:hypothetical protein